jgi:hypothetical protein
MNCWDKEALDKLYSDQPVTDPDLDIVDGLLIWLRQNQTSTEEAFRLANQYRTAILGGQGDAWLDHFVEPKGASKRELLRVELSKSGFASVRRVDDPLIGVELEAAAKRVFEGGYRCQSEQVG